jgi:hypothetical protein
MYAFYMYQWAVARAQQQVDRGASGATTPKKIKF